MCRRTVIAGKVEDLEVEYGATFNYPFQPIYNGAPTNMLPVITNDNPLIQQFRFGFIAPWNPKLPVFNTVGESVTEKDVF